MVCVSFWETLQETKQERENFGPAVRAFTAVCCREAGAGWGWLGPVAAGPAVGAFTAVCYFGGSWGWLGTGRVRYEALVYCQLFSFVYQLFCLLRVCQRDEGMFRRKPVGNVNFGGFDLGLCQGG